MKVRPERKAAALYLAREYAESILAGSLQPYKGASLIWRQLSFEARPDDRVLDPFIYWASE